MVDVVLNSRAQPVYLVNPFNGEPYTLATAADGVTTADRIVATLNGVPQNGSLQDVYVSSAGNISVGALVPTLGVAATVSIPIAIYKVA